MGVYVVYSLQCLLSICPSKTCPYCPPLILNKTNVCAETTACIRAHTLHLLSHKNWPQCAPNEQQKPTDFFFQLPEFRYAKSSITLSMLYPKTHDLQDHHGPFLQRQWGASTLQCVCMCVSSCLCVCVPVACVPDGPQMGTQAGNSAFWL